MKKRNSWMMRLLAMTLTASMSLEPAWMLRAEEVQVIEENTEELDDGTATQITDVDIVGDTEMYAEGETQEESSVEADSDEEIILSQSGEETEWNTEEEQILEEAEESTEILPESEEETEAAELMLQAESSQEKITIYALNPGVTAISIPAGWSTSYRIPVQENGEKATYQVISGDGITVDESGLVTPRLHKVNVISSGGSYVREQYEYGENTVEVCQGNEKWTVTVEVANYATCYARKKMDDYIAANIPASLSEFEKVKAVCEWLSKNFDYSASYSSSTSLMIYGAGDCWANTAAVNYMCEKMGIKVYDRYAANDPGAGSGHMNTIAIINGEKYIVDCGYDGKAPRYYTLEKMELDYSLSLQKDGTWKITQYEGTDPNVVVPDMINGKKVTTIGKMAFAHAVIDVESVTLPDSITTLEDGAFYGCGKLKSIRIPKNVSSIGLRLAGGNYRGDALTEIQVDPENPYFTSKDGVLFNKAGTELLAFPTGRGGSYQVPEGTAQIGGYAFHYSINIKSVILPDSVKIIKEGAFGDCSSLEHIELPEGLESVEDFAFTGTSKLDYITIPASVVKIGDGAFRYGPIRVKVLGKNVQFGEKVMTGATGSIIAAPEGSTAESYAKANGHTFLKMNQDGTVSMDASWFQDVPGSYVYDGTEKRPPLWTKKETPGVNSTSDYQISYRNNVNAGTASIVITGKGLFSGEIEKTFTISPQNMDYFREIYFKDNGNSRMTLEANGSPLEPEVCVNGMEKGKDYEVVYSDNINPGVAKATVIWKGNYTGKRVLLFIISPKGGENGQLSGNGGNKTTSKKTIIESEVIDNKDSETQGTQNQWSIQIKKANCVYNGKTQKPKVTVKSNGKTVKSSAYKVTYKNSKKAGVATVTVTGKGRYKGYKTTATFRIRPQKVNFSKAKGVKNGLSLKWKKNSQASGYQIQYATDKKFRKNVGSMELKKGGRTSATIRSLAGKKTYYLRIRAYKKSGTVIVYGDWSKSKKVKTK